VCGIVGVATSGALRADGSVERALSRLEHRGPDARALMDLSAPQVSCRLGHTRLRIIDLSPAADQPMPNESGSAWLVYNGEIYNHVELRAELVARGHRFRSASDAEVVIHLYEELGDRPEHLLERLRGMFAFAIFDTETGRVLLARDRLGIKPMYWTYAAGTIAFASEARTLVESGLAPSELDEDTLSGYLIRGVIPGPKTAFAAVRQLPPGSFLDWRGGDPRETRWWSPEVRPDPEIAADGDRLLRGVLSDAVGRHLVADRPIGLFLSAGIDSGVVATLAARASDARAFSVTFPEADADEGAAAAARADELGITHESAPVLGADVARSLPEFISSMDQPTHDGLNTWLVSRAARAAGLVVAMSGVGGDELFGGYPTFATVPRIRLLDRALRPVPAATRARMSRAVSRRSPGSRAARILGAGPGHDGAYIAARGLFAPGELGNGSRRPFVGDTSLATADSLGSRDRVTLLETSLYLADQLLRDTDQMSMAHSLEVRVPLLDDVVVRTALALPARARMAPGKALLARAAGMEPSRRKQGFTLPMDEWLRGPLYPELQRGLLSEELPLTTVVPPEIRRRLWESFMRRKVHWSRPWAVSVLRLWAEAHRFGS
jgi:asparagine synthase (glutamine-hydrolysing)